MECRRVNEVSVNNVDLNSAILVGNDASIASNGGSKKEYIKGHVTDGATSVTLKINGVATELQCINGEFKYEFPDNSSIISLREFAYNVYNLKDITFSFKKIRIKDFYHSFRCDSTDTNLTDIHGLDTLTFADNTINSAIVDCFTRRTYLKEAIFKPQKVLGYANSISQLFYNCTNLKKVVFPLDILKLNNIQAMFVGCNKVEYIELPVIYENVTTTNSFSACTSLKDVVCSGFIKSNLNLAGSNLLTEQSVVNLFNAIQADGIIITFHPTVGAIIDAQMDAEEGAIFDAYMASDYDFNYTY